jgi:hypothetical protein
VALEMEMEEAADSEWAERVGVLLEMKKAADSETEEVSASGMDRM